jgi:hypothetical protein
VTKAKTLTDQRAELESALAEAEDALSAARHRLRTGRSDAGREVVAPLVEFTDAIDHNRPDATPEADRADRKRELIREFFDAIEERGLTLDPVRSNEGFALAITDPSIDADYAAALRAKNEAVAALREFDRDHGEQLQAERDKADADAIREALAGDDPEAIRAALERREESERSARQATADKLVSGAYEGWEDDANRSEPAPATDALTTADTTG